MANPVLSGKDKLMNRIKANPLSSKLLVELKSNLQSKKAKQIIIPYVGNGYNYEIESVNQALHNQLHESPVMSMAETVEIMNTMDEIRAQWKT